jgi:hypothetical protein
MKRFFIFSFVTLALMVGAAGVSPDASDETCPTGYDYDANVGCQPISTGAETCMYGYMYDANAGCIPDDSITGATPDRAAQNTPNNDLPKNPDKGEGFGKVMTWIASLFAWLTGAGAVALDYSVYYTVVTMGNYVNNLAAIGVTWQVMRDIGNIVMIFGFLAIGICIILGVEWYGGGTKMLPKLLIAAVFLNFSLFITEAVIDTGNLFATQFYTQIKGGNLPAENYMSSTSFMQQIEREGISNKIMAQVGLLSMYTQGRTNTLVFQAGNTWVIGFMAILLFLVTAFVFFSLAFVLIARFVVLLLLIIVAPIGFAGWAIPNLKSTADMWWKELFKQTITAPVLLLLLYIALAIITDVSFLTGFCAPGSTATFGGPNNNTGCTSNAIGWVSGNMPGFATFLLTFFVAMGLLLAVVIFSKKLSAFGAEKASAHLTLLLARFVQARLVVAKQVGYSRGLPIVAPKRASMYAASKLAVDWGRSM